MEIAYLAVSKDCQHQGIGSTIIKAITQRAVKTIKNCQFIKVEAYHIDNYSAVDFYRKYGFEISTPLPIGDVWPLHYVITPHAFKDEE